MQYRDRMDVQLYNGHVPQDDYDKLIASDLKPDTVDTIMGNSSWTRLTCSACNEPVDRAVDVDVTGGEYTTHICEGCAKKIMEEFK